MLFLIIAQKDKQIQLYNVENLALLKTTWEQNPWPNVDEYKTANAVDGRYTNRGAYGGQCTISNDGKYTAEWRVDLGNVVSISQIDIYYRTENTSRFPIFFLINLYTFSSQI